MKAIRIDRTGGPDVLTPVDLDAPAPGPGQIVVRQRAIGVNYIDVYVRTGLYPRPLPLVPGREGAGVVAAVGPDVSDIRVGERVVYPDVGGGGLGGYAEQVAIDARWAIPIPDGIDDAVACAAMVQGMTADYLLRSTYEVGPQTTLLVHAAAGGVGQLLVPYAKHLGARVIATCSTAKVDRVRALGADDVIDYTATDFAAETKRLVPEGVDVVYDSVGKTTFDGSLAVLRPRGLLVLFGTSSGPIPPIDPQRLSLAGSLFFTRPTLVHYTRTREETLERAHRVFALIRDGVLRVEIGGRYALADAARAHADLEARRTAGKLVLVP